MLNKMLFADLKNIKYFFIYGLSKIWTCMRLYGAKNLKTQKKGISLKM